MDAFVFFSKKEKEEKERGGEGRGGKGGRRKKLKENHWLVSGLIQSSRAKEQCRPGAGVAEPARC